MSVRVFGMEREAGLALAHHLGRALQLTNILRDLDEDAAIGRLYLPREALRGAGIISDRPATVLAIRRSAKPARCGRSGAAAFRGRRGHHGAKPAPAVRAPRIMGEAYRAILDSLIARGLAPPRAPVRHSRAGICFWIVLRNLV